MSCAALVALMHATSSLMWNFRSCSYTFTFTAACMSCPGCNRTGTGVGVRVD